MSYKLDETGRVLDGRLLIEVLVARKTDGLAVGLVDFASDG